MSLQTRVEERYSKSFLAGLTNPDSPDSTQIDQGRLANAATDVAAVLETYGSAAYDDDDARHVAVGVAGVIVTLKTYTGRADPQEYDTWIQRVRELGKATGRKRVLAKSTSKLTPTDELRGASSRKPEADETRFDDYFPRSPTGGAE